MGSSPSRNGSTKYSLLLFMGTTMDFLFGITLKRVTRLVKPGLSTLPFLLAQIFTDFIFGNAHSYCSLLLSCVSLERKGSFSPY